MLKGTKDAQWQGKKEMLADGLSQKRRQEFLIADGKKPKMPRDLDSYISFLMAVQAIKPFEHKRVVTQADKNILWRVALED